MAGAGSPRRRYDSPVRRRRLAETRARIVAAGSALVHELPSWDWRGLTFRAVAERAGVGERTVYRHFPTERQLHDAVMRRLEREAGVDYEAVELATVAEVTARIMRSLERFAVGSTVAEPDDPTFRAVDVRRHQALLRAMGEAAPGWSEPQREAAAAVLDVLWNPPSYERLVSSWRFDPDRATAALSWVIGLVVEAVESGQAPASS
jgi:AcrR family transcriptional regulator